MIDKHIALEVSKDEHYRTPYLKSLKENWPSLAKDYRHYCHVYHPSTGDIWVWTSPEGQKFFHLVLDETTVNSHVGGHRLQSFKQALKKMKKIIEAESIKKLELPKVGFAFTDAEFDLATSLVKEIFLDLDTEIKFV